MDEKYLKEVIASLIEECLPEGVNYSPAGYLSKTNRPTGVQSWNPDAQAQFAAAEGERISQLNSPSHKNPVTLAQQQKIDQDSAERLAYANKVRQNRKDEYKAEDEIISNAKTPYSKPPEELVANSTKTATVNQTSQPGESRPDVNQILKVLNSKQ